MQKTVREWLEELPIQDEKMIVEAVIKNFSDWWNEGNKEPQDTVISEGAVSDFLTSKYGKG